MTDGSAHRVVLVVARHLLDQSAIVFEEYEVAQVIQQGGWVQYTAHQGLQFFELAQRVQVHAVDGAPLQKALGVGRQAAQAGIRPVRDDQQLVGLEHVGDLLFVGLNLVVGLPDVGVLVSRVLQLDEGQRQAVDEQDDVWATSMVRAFDGELVDGPELVARRFSPIDQAYEVADRFAVLLVLHRHAPHQQLVESAVGRQQGWNAKVQYPLQGVFTGTGGNVGVQALDGFAQAKRQHHLAIVGTLGVGAIVGDVVAGVDRIAQLGEPAQGFLFELVFGHRLIVPVRSVLPLLEAIHSMRNPHLPRSCSSLHTHFRETAELRVADIRLSLD